MSVRQPKRVKGANHATPFSDMLRRIASVGVVKRKTVRVSHYDSETGVKGRRRIILAVLDVD